jgi:HPt (histidine-containing phosphotransfer) domain-containing protein
MTHIKIDQAAAVECMGDRDLYVAIAHSFAEMMPETLGEIASAMKAKNWPEARRLVHSLKGNCAAMGADEVREQVYAVEKACAAAEETLVAKLYPPLLEELAALREALISL